MKRKSIILGGGITGIAAGYKTGWPVYEAEDCPGGLCSSYYVRPNSGERLHQTPKDEEAYRFEIGGGHWIFGGDPETIKFIDVLAPLKKYARRSSVYFRKKDLYVPYPLQNNLRFLDKGTIAKALREITAEKESFRTMEEWLKVNLGPVLCRLFFYPFHDLYTAGLHKTIASQDAYKSPINISSVIQGASSEAPPVGYNATFVYPEKGLNELTRKMAERCDIHYGKRIVKIDVHTKEIFFSDKKSEKYDVLISTLPLNKMMEMTGLSVDAEPFPYTSVLVLNVGAKRGRKCPDEHWLYNPDAQSGFHRVGFYSNVDSSFLPKAAREQQNRVGIYVERSFLGGEKPNSHDIEIYQKMVIAELQDWGFIGEAEVIDPTWIEVAYTWSWPDTDWKELAIKKLREHGIYPLGRYGRWNFQGIAESIKEGMDAPNIFNRKRLE